MNSRKKGQRFVKWAWVLPMVALVLASFASGGARLILAEDGTAPRFWVWPELDGVEGLRWHGAVTITFDDDFDVSNGYLHSTSASVDEQGSFQLWLDAFDVQAGQVVTVDDGLASRVHQVTGLRIESMDRLTDKVSGWATPYAEVEVEAGDDSGSSRRTVMADGDGNWVADFSVPWDGEPALDIGDDTAAQATQWDTAGGDGTRVYRRQPNSRFWVWPELDGVEGLRWHGAVTITFDDDFDVSNGYLHSTSASVDEQGSFQLWLDAFDVQAGQVVTVDDGLASRVHQVTGLRIEVVDMQADTISGWATPNAEVEVEAGNDSGSSRRTVMADGDGNWVADFSVPWDGEPALDIGPGSGAEATQWDTAGGDGTRVFRRLRAPRFDVQPLDDFVRGEDWWPVGAEVTLTIDDPSTPEQPDYAQTEMVVPSPSDPEQTSVGFDFGHAFDVEPGHLVRLTDGISTKEHVVTNVAVSYVSTGADRVVGTADPGARIDILAHPFASWACRHETADAAGNWLADFAVPGDEADEQGTFDIRPGKYVAVHQQDDDGDRTTVGRSAPNPRFDVQPLDDFVDGIDWWPVGAEVTLTIDDPSTPEQPDYAQTEMVVPSPWDPEYTSVGFDFGHAFDVQPGHLVTLTDGITTKEHLVTDVAVSYVSTGADRVVGTADPGARIDIRAIGDAGWACRHETADAAGNWLADFAVPGDEADEQGTFDIRPGEYVAVDQADDDWDRTSIELSAPVADAGPDRTVIRGETVLFDGSGSSDADGTIEAYDWDFGDGNTGSGIATTHVYADAGPYVATLTVTDNDGAQATDAAVVMVQTPQEATEDVVDVVQEMELDQGIEDSLIDKLQNAIDYLNTGQIDQAIGALRALMHETEALRGKKLTDEQADQLITAAQRILNSI